MSKEAFVRKNFKRSSLEIIEAANEIIDEYRAQGFDLSLRQLFYQFVSRDILPNTQRQYKSLGGIISDARLAGLIDWDSIVDRVRATEINSHWTSPAEIVRACAHSFRIDKWADQPVHVEVMSEKDALSGVLVPTCNKLDVGFTANRGYSSQSFMYRKGKSLGWKSRRKRIVILYVGDHDPSGLDMDRDVVERLSMFAGTPVEFTRLALTYDQVEDWSPPPNPAKMSDVRAPDYVARYGRESWELDAVNPTTLAKLVTDAVEDLRDDHLWEKALRREEKMRAELDRFADEYEEPDFDEDDLDD